MLGVKNFGIENSCVKLQKINKGPVLSYKGMMDCHRLADTSLSNQPTPASYLACDFSFHYRLTVSQNLTSRSLTCINLPILCNRS